MYDVGVPELSEDAPISEAILEDTSTGDDGVFDLKPSLVCDPRFGVVCSAYNDPEHHLSSLLALACSSGSRSLSVV